MGTRRVGVVSDDDALFVGLALRGEDLEVDRVAGTEDLSDFDVVLVEVAAASEGAQVVDGMPDGPRIVLLSPEARAVEGATVVLRPCSMEGLIDVLRDVENERDQHLVITVDGPAPVQAHSIAGTAARTTPELDGTAPTRRPTTRPTPTPAPAPLSLVVPEDGVAAPPSPGTPPLEEWAARVRETASVAASPTGYANAVAEAIVHELEGDHAAVWRHTPGGYVVAGAAGLSDGARRMRLSDQHPVVQLARVADGLLHRGVDHQGARAPGLPGSNSPAYAMVLLDEATVPVHLVTLSGPDLPLATVERVRDLVLSVYRDWPFAVDAAT